jgi:hypothetical protein
LPACVRNIAEIRSLVRIGMEEAAPQTRGRVSQDLALAAMHEVGLDGVAVVVADEV